MTLADITHPDQVLDFANVLIAERANPRRYAAARERAQARAHAAGHSACAVCGRAVTDDARSALRLAGEVIGPECAKRFVAAVAAG
jgi:hypothetical protein